MLDNAEALIAEDPEYGILLGEVFVRLILSRSTLSGYMVLNSINLMIN